MENCGDKNYSPEILTEVSPYAPTKLKEIEETFAILKKSTNNKKARIKLLTQIKEFSKIREVILFFDDEYNAGVIPVYKKAKIKEIFESFVNLLKKDRKINIAPEQLQNLQTVKDSETAIERVYIFIGKPLIKTFQPDELVAILLHEFGHVFSTKSTIPDTFIKFLSFLTNYFGLAVNLILVKYVLGYLSLMFELFFLFTLFMYGIMHGITFTQRFGEIKADNYVLKYGYGDSLLTAISKFKIKERPRPGLKYKIKEFFQQLFDVISIIVAPTTHPSNEKRIKNLQDQIFKEYKKIYPQYREIIDLVHADYTTQGVITK